jgi:hypothetical protein
MENTTEDSLAIDELLETYFKGIYEGSARLLHSLYHPSTLLFCDLEGQPRTKTVILYLNGVAHRQSPRESGKPFKGEVISVCVINSIAVARVRVSMYDFNYHEFLSFHKTESRWLIVNKLITHAPE